MTDNHDGYLVSMILSVLARLDHADVRADVAAAVAALSKGDAKALEEILKRYRVEVEGQAQPFYDPEFTRLFAVNARPIWLADLLLRLDRDPDVDLEWYAGFLDSLAGVLSTGAHEMTEAQLAVFTENWAAINNEVVTGPRIPTKADLPVTTYTPRVQALSLLVGRGDWPESFLTGVKTGIEAQEGDLGAAHWLSHGVSVRDPAVVDSATGEAMTVADPMYGIYRAGAVNPEWFIENYGGQITTVEYIMGGRNDPVTTRASPVSPPD